MKKILIRHVFVYPFPDRSAFLDTIENKHKILIAVNAEKILNEAPKLQQIINENIGYADGFGTVMALKQKGLNAVKEWLTMLFYVNENGIHKDIQPF